MKKRHHDHLRLKCTRAHARGQLGKIRVLAFKDCCFQYLVQGLIWLTYCHDTKFYCIWLKSPVCQLHFFTIFAYIGQDFGFIINSKVKRVKKKSSIPYFKLNQIHSIIGSQDGMNKTPIIWYDTRRLDGKNQHKRMPGIEFNTSLQVLKLKT